MWSGWSHLWRIRWSHLWSNLMHRCITSYQRWIRITYSTWQRRSIWFRSKCRKARFNKLGMSVMYIRQENTWWEIGSRQLRALWWDLYSMKIHGALMRASLWDVKGHKYGTPYNQMDQNLNMLVASTKKLKRRHMVQHSSRNSINGVNRSCKCIILLRVGKLWMK